MLEVHHIKLFYHLIKNRNVKKYIFEKRLYREVKTCYFNNHSSISSLLFILSNTIIFNPNINLSVRAERP